jgi:dihydrodipicolinate synthase/N-acetylneuraminate lyase
MDERLALFSNGVVIPAMPLALNDDGSRNEASQRAVLRYYLTAGAGGVAVGVHSTQFAIREKGLFKRVLADAAEVINEYEKKNAVVKLKIAGICGETEQAVTEAETTKALGYDYALLSPGGLACYDDDYLIKRSEAVA